MAAHVQVPQHAVRFVVVVSRRGVDVVLGCRCKNCSNNAVANVPGTQQHSPVEIHELEQEELLHDELLRMEYGEEVVMEEETDEDNYSSEEGEGSEDQGIPDELF